MANNNHFELTLDTLAPTGSVGLSGKAEIYENKALTINKGDANYMKLWFDTKAVGDAADAPEAWIDADTKYTTNFTTGGNYYYHMILMDDVGNESEVYSTSIIVFDPEIPEISSVTLPTITATRENIAYSVAFSDPDPSSGITKLHIKYSYTDKTSGEVVTKSLTDVDTPKSGTEYHFTFDSSDPDVTQYTFSFTVEDAAGNISEAKEAKIILNTTVGDLNLTLLTTDEATKTSLPDYINYHDIRAELVCDNDLTIVGYKVWEEGSEEPADYTTQEEGALNVIVPLTLSANDGVKTVHAKMINTAGTVVTAEDKSVSIDSVGPKVSLTTDRTIISTISGYTTAKLTLSGDDQADGYVIDSKVKSWKLVLGTTETSTNITDGTELPSSFDLTKTSGNMGDDGVYTLTLFVYDNAGNKGSAAVEITLDTTAPTVELNDLTGTAADTNGWYNAVIANAKTTYSDTNNISHLYVWVSTTEEDTTPVSGCEVTPVPASPYSIPTSVINNSWLNAVQGDKNYLHIKVIDEVGNAAVATKSFKVDTEAPISLTASFQSTTYNTTTGVIDINALDSTSGVVGYDTLRVTGNIANPTTADSWETYTTTRNIKFNDATESTTVTVTVQVKDAAGNIRTETVTTSTEYDPIAPQATLILRKPDDSADKETPTSVAAFKARVSGTDDEGKGQASYYQIYGDCSTSEGSSQGVAYDEKNGWKELKYDDGQTYMTISDLYLTVPDGDKTIYLVVKDNAGNISAVTSVQIELDTEAPIVTVSDIDYQRISIVHELRRSSATATIEGKYNDQMHFTFTPDSLIQAYKVCAYKDQAAALAVTDPADEVAIPQAGDTATGLTPSSTNMHATNLSSKAAVSSMIAGADFEYALAGKVLDDHSFDGTHIVVVYVQDLAGTWSEAAVFSA